MAVLGLLTAAAEAQPLLCVVDDAHWLDGASAEALVFVARRLQAEPIAVLIGAREGDARRFDAHGLPELRLARPERRRRRARCSTARLPAVVREDLVGATGGNPLALLELPVALTDDERTGRAPLRLDLPLNERIERAFMVRVEPLGDDARRLLVLAAADDSGDVGTLLRASERLGFGPDALDVAERAGLLTAEARGCASAIRSCARRSTAPRASPSAARRTRRSAAVLDDDADVDRRAWHRAAAATAPDDDGGAGAGPHRRPRREPRRAHGRRPRAGARRRARFRSAAPRRSGSWRPPSPRRWPAGSAMPWRCSIVPSPSCATRWRAAPRRGCAAMVVDGRRATGGCATALLADAARTLLPADRARRAAGC